MIKTPKRFSSFASFMTSQVKSSSSRRANLARRRLDKLAHRPRPIASAKQMIDDFEQATWEEIEEMIAITRAENAEYEEWVDDYMARDYLDFTIIETREWSQQRPAGFFVDDLDDETYEMDLREGTYEMEFFRPWFTRIGE